jgi:CheY-like chemotaxis protein
MNTLLIVADKVFSLKLASELQEVCDTVDCVRSALEAYYFINRNDYDLIILDNGLPDTDGIQIAQKLINEEPQVKIVLIFFNGEKCKLEKLFSPNILHLTNSDCRKGLLHKLKEENILS